MPATNQTITPPSGGKPTARVAPRLARVLRDGALRTTAGRLAARRILNLIPFRAVRAVLRLWLKALMYLDEPRAAMLKLAQLSRDVEEVVGQAGINYDGGVHVKHRVTRYHDFFVERVRPGERVLDVGCGKGELAYDLAARGGATVVGIDFNRDYLEFARSRFASPQVSYVEADAVTWQPDGPFDVVVLSNVLEHLADRPALLRRWVELVGGPRFLVRVPAFDRHWLVPVCRELGLPYFSDATHEIEYTEAGFRHEMRDAHLEVVHLQVNWGEIWAELVPAASDGSR
jgi:SAM-dependent methyltransferase